MKVIIKYFACVYSMNDDGIFKCLHANTEVVAPCCSPFGKVVECTCQGKYTVLCHDCNGDDFEDNQIITAEITEVALNGT